MPKRTRILTVRLTPEEYRKVQQVAARGKLTPSELTRLTLEYFCDDVNRWLSRLPAPEATK